MNTKGNAKIFITGGHLAPALAVIEELQKERPDVEIIFVGRMKATDTDREPSQEYKEVRRRNIVFLPIVTGRFGRFLSLRTLVSFVKIPLGFLQACWYVFFYQPALILSFGGYIAFPVACAGALFRVPVFIHEQTRELGLVNRIVAFFAKKVLVSYWETASTLDQQKIIYTGLPIRKVIFEPTQEPSFAYEKNIPLVYITGGTTGAKSLNDLIFPIVHDLTGDYMVIHQTGPKSLSTATQVREALGQNNQKRYVAGDYFDQNDVSWIYHHATIVLGRSGANTVGELAALGKIALFIPLPWAGGNEQYKNAKMLEDAGSAIIASQEGLTLEKLLKNIHILMHDRKKYEKNALEFAKFYPRNGASKIVSEIISSFPYTASLS